jgi:hypothetical protein
MAEFIVMKTYRPRVIIGTGATQTLDPHEPDYAQSPGQALHAALVKFSALYEKEGWPGLEIWAPREGQHTMLVTVQRWDSLDEYEETKKVMATPEIHSCVNNDINPNIERYYDEHHFNVRS